MFLGTDSKNTNAFGVGAKKHQYILENYSTFLEYVRTKTCINILGSSGNLPKYKKHILILIKS